MTKKPLSMILTKSLVCGNLKLTTAVRRGAMNLQSFQIQKNDSGQRLDRFIGKLCPTLPTPLLYKYIRKKRIKVNRRKPEVSYRLAEGDVVELYIHDDFFKKPAKSSIFLQAKPTFSIVYEDENLLLVDKPPGVAVQTDAQVKYDSLVDQIQLYLYQHGSYNPSQELSFSPAVCNRLDRGTGGIVIAAKTAEALRSMNALIRSRALCKQYLCAVCGKPPAMQGVLRCYLRKDAAHNRVTVLAQAQPNAKYSVTQYRVLCTEQGLSLVEATLQTGRSHQIRAQFSHAGFPLLGDDKYGNRALNQRYGMHSQALYAYRITFPELPDSHLFHGLSGRSFCVSSVPFCSLFSACKGGLPNAR